VGIMGIVSFESLSPTARHYPIITVAGALIWTSGIRGGYVDFYALQSRNSVY
jgi:hypothetical protein